MITIVWSCPPGLLLACDCSIFSCPIKVAYSPALFRDCSWTMSSPAPAILLRQPYTQYFPGGCPWTGPASGSSVPPLQYWAYCSPGINPCWCPLQPHPATKPLGPSGLHRECAHTRPLQDQERQLFLLIYINVKEIKIMRQRNVVQMKEQNKTPGKNKPQ